MIQISFIYNREILNFAIQDRIIKYTDRKWGKWIQCIPKDKDFIMKVTMSRGKFPHFLIKMFELTNREQDEYNNAKTDEELSQVIIRDAKGKGCKLLYKKYEESPTQTIIPEDNLKNISTTQDGL
jgi:hypothetical protein